MGLEHLVNYVKYFLSLRMKKLFIVLAALVLVLGAIIGLKATQIASLIGFAGEMEKAGMPPMPVATMEVKKDFWEDTLEFTGSLRAVQGVTLSAEVGGTVTRIAVENGATVKAGDTLIEIDARQERADLASAQARLRLAKINLDRAKGLLDKRIVARSEYDSAQAAYDEAAATVENLQAVISKKTILAPFAGQAGIRLVNVGQTVSPGDPLLPLFSNDPIYVEFDVPQTRLDKVATGQTLRLSADGLDVPADGTISAINPVVSEATRSARVQGTLKNPGNVLRPGQFVQVEVLMPTTDEVLAVPASAIQSAAYGDSVFVVEEKEGKLVARQQFVQLGRQRGDFVAVTKGLAAGERVVSAGAFKLNNGAVVTVDDTMQPEAVLDPELDNS